MMMTKMIMSREKTRSNDDDACNSNSKSCNIVFLNLKVTLGIQEDYTFGRRVSSLGENSSSSEECISQAGCPSRTANLSKRNGYFCWDWVQSTEDPALQSTICQDRRQLRREDNFEIETVDR